MERVKLRPRRIQAKPPVPCQRLSEKRERLLKRQIQIHAVNAPVRNVNAPSHLLRGVGPLLRA